MNSRVIGTIVCTLGFLVLATTLSAAPEALIANIPFNFSFGDQGLSRGQYTVNVVNGKVIQLMNSDGRVLFSLSQNASPEKTKAGNVLVFRRYGDSYFLSKVVWASGSGWELPKSRGETEAARQHPGSPTIETATAK